MQIYEAQPNKTNKIDIKLYDLKIKLSEYVNKEINLFFIDFVVYFIGLVFSFNKIYKQLNLIF